MDYYKLLEIGRNATPEQIKEAYRKLAIKWHPDVNRSEEAVEVFKKVVNAYETLEDPHKKFIYDQRNPPEKPRPEPKPKKEIDLADDPNLGNHRTPIAPIFDIWGNRMTPKQRKQWEEEAKNLSPIPKRKAASVNWSNLMYEEDYESESQPYIR